MLEIVVSAAATLIVTAMIGMASWIGSKINQHGEKMARLEERLTLGIKNLDDRIDRLERKLP